MNKRIFALGIAAAAILALLAATIINKKSGDWNSGAGGKLLPGLDVNSVAKITVRDGGEQITAERKDGVWRVAEKHDHPANFKKITDFILDFEHVDAPQRIRVGDSQMPRIEVMPPDADKGAGIEVCLYDGEANELAKVLLGKRHYSHGAQASPFGRVPDGRYAKSDGAVYLINNPFRYVTANPVDWINRKLLEIKDVKNIAVTNSPRGDWKASRAEDNGDFTLAEKPDDRELDQNKLRLAVGSFGNIMLEDVMPSGSEEAEKILAKPTVVELSTFGGIKYKIELAERDGKSYIHIAEAMADKKTADAEKDEAVGEALKTAGKRGGWLYRFAKRQYDSVITDPEGFLKPEEDDEPTPAINQQAPPMSGPFAAPAR